MGEQHPARRRKRSGQKPLQEENTLAANKTEQPARKRIRPGKGAAAEARTNKSTDGQPAKKPTGARRKPTSRKPVKRTRTVRKTKVTLVDGVSFAGKTPSLKAIQKAAKDLDLKDAYTTVCLPASFGHSLNEEEKQLFDTAIAKGTIVCPPAGSCGGLMGFYAAVAARRDVTVISAKGTKRHVRGARCVNAYKVKGRWTWEAEQPASTRTTTKTGTAASRKKPSAKPEAKASADNRRRRRGRNSTRKIV